jgi:hypothetical protein
MNTSFTLTGANTYTFKVDFLDDGVGNPETFTGTLAAGDIGQVRLFNFNAGFNNDQFYNNISIVPEPSTYLAALVAVAALVLCERRRYFRLFAALQRSP